jgi:hypothetical protein
MGTGKLVMDYSPLGGPEVLAIPSQIQLPFINRRVTYFPRFVNSSVSKGRETEMLCEAGQRKSFGFGSSRISSLLKNQVE